MKTMNAVPKSLRNWFLVVLLTALLLRLGMFFLYSPVSYGDTNSYRRLAASVLNAFERYDGTRTPGYPIWLAALGPDERVWLAQMSLGLAITHGIIEQHGGTIEVESKMGQGTSFIIRLPLHNGDNNDH